MAVSKEKTDSLKERMAQSGLREEDLIEKFILGSGKGGQKINKTASCVYLKHLPTGIEIKCQQSRSRELNRYIARQELCEKIDQIHRAEKSEKQMEIEKIRRQKRRRSRKQKAKLVADKRKRSSTKQSRQPPRGES